MTTLRVCPIVEGHGEVSAVRPLLDRVWREIVGGTYVDVTRPIRHPKSQLVKKDGIERAARLAAAILSGQTAPVSSALILVLLDADDDCPAEIGPQLEARAKTHAGAFKTACVVANIEYETWFIGGVRTLGDVIDVPLEGPPPLPEHTRQGKGWIESHWKGPKYSETVDQIKLTVAFHLEDARARCPSFDKLCRTMTAVLE